MEQNKILIEKCAEIRAKRQREREIKGCNEDYWSPGLIEPYDVIDVTNFSIKQFYVLSEAIQEGYALKYGEITERMTISTDPRITKIIKEEFGESGYTLIGGKISSFKPFEGKTVHIDLYSDEENKGNNWGEFHQLMIWLVGTYGFIVRVIEPPEPFSSWKWALNDHFSGYSTLVNTRKEALDFSYYWNESIFE
jgi:hypothetical protein